MSTKTYDSTSPGSLRLWVKPERRPLLASMIPAKAEAQLMSDGWQLAEFREVEASKPSATRGMKISDFDVWHKPCARCGFDPGKGNANACWKCGHRLERDFSERALKIPAPAAPGGEQSESVKVFRHFKCDCPGDQHWRFSGDNWQIAENLIDGKWEADTSMTLEDLDRPHYYEFTPKVAEPSPPAGGGLLIPRHDMPEWMLAHEYEWFRTGWAYASTQTYAIPAMAKISPVEAFHLMEAIKRGPSVMPTPPPAATPLSKKAKPEQINTRLFDLVRYMRSDLLDADLITGDEWGWLLSGSDLSKGGGSPSPRRLEDYDELRKRMTELERESAGLREELDWQPIATAPRNETPIDIWDGFERFAAARFSMTHGKFVRESLPDMNGDTYDIEIIQPTHWRKITTP